MTCHRYRARGHATLAAGLIFCFGFAGSDAAEISAKRAATDFPSKPIRFIEAFGAGGTTDYLSRLIGQKLTERFGQQIVVDNRVGAGGNIGAEMSAKATPDGYTLFMGVVPILAAARSMYKHLNYDVVKDFDGVIMMVSGNYVLVAGPSLPVKSVAELVAAAKSRQLRYSSSGVGSTLHLAMEMLKSMTGANMLHVPYKGGPPMITAIAAGEVDTGAPSLTLAQPLIRAGRLTALAVTGAQRAKEFPQIPTVAESGIAGYDLTPWYAAFAPAGTPRSIVRLLNAAINDILQLPGIQTSLGNQGLEAAGGPPERVKQVLQAEIAKWTKVIKDANIKAE
jgi:tripartite-type tricarboxylate transporter receptor subunit TctC